jgi:hypothetical protein
VKVLPFTDPIGGPQKTVRSGSPAAAAFNRGTVVDVVAFGAVVGAVALGADVGVVAVVVEVDVELLEVVEVEVDDVDMVDALGAAAA